MPSPFPGMDPYLERPSRWLGFHNKFVVALSFALNEALPPGYSAEVDERVLLVEDDTPRSSRRPDVSILGSDATPIKTVSQPGGVAVLERPEKVKMEWVEWIDEWFLEVRDDDDVVVTVIEVLSPTNKSNSDGRKEYLAKRKRVLASETNLVEIDLLREGPRFVTRATNAPFDYYVLIAKPDNRSEGDLFPFTIRDPIPRFVLPLRPPDVGPIVDLNEVLRETYDRSHLERRVNYSQDPVPPLNGDDAAWADALLREKGLR